MAEANVEMTRRGALALARAQVASGKDPEDVETHVLNYATAAGLQLSEADEIATEAVRLALAERLGRRI